MECANHEPVRGLMIRGSTFATWDEPFTEISLNDLNIILVQL